MKPFNNTYIRAGFISLLAAAFTGWLILSKDDQRSNQNFESAETAMMDARKPPGLDHSDSKRSEVRPKRTNESQIEKLGRLENERTEPRPLDWTLAELEFYLDEKSKVLTKSEMKYLVTGLLPAPEGAMQLVAKMPAGSVGLGDQARLCQKYTGPEDLQEMILGLWGKYSQFPDSEAFLGEVAPELVSGRERDILTQQVIAKLFSDSERFVTVFTSETAVDEILPKFFISLNHRKAIIEGFQSGAIRIVDSGKLSKDEMISIVENSKFDSEMKLKIIQHVADWTAKSTHD